MVRDDCDVSSQMAERFEYSSINTQSQIRLAPLYLLAGSYKSTKKKYFLTKHISNKIGETFSKNSSGYK